MNDTTGLDVEAVLRRHLGDGSDDCAECCACETVDEYIAHVAAVLREHIDSALGDVLREAADAIANPSDRDITPTDPHSFAIWLRRRADQINPYRASLAADEGDVR